MSMGKRRGLEIAEVIWKDAFSCGIAHSLDKEQILLHKNFPIVANVGYLLHKDKESIILCENLKSHCKGEVIFENTTTIPASWIVRVKKLK